MKKILVTLFLLLCLCVPAYATNFVSVIKEGHYLAYVDVDSIESRKTHSDEYLVAWIKFVYLGDYAKEESRKYMRPVDYELLLWALNKNATQTQLLSISVYDKNDSIIKRESRPFNVNNYEEIPPTSAAKEIYDFVINYKK